MLLSPLSIRTALLLAGVALLAGPAAAASLELKLTIPKSEPVSAVSYKLLKRGDNGRPAVVAQGSIAGRELSQKITDLAPGEYLVAAWTGEPDQRENGDRPGAFSASQVIKLGEEDKSVTLKWEAPDFKPFAGSASRTGVVRDPKGNPVAGLRLRLAGAHPSAGLRTQSSTRTKSDGTFTFGGINPSAEYLILAGDTNAQLAYLQPGDESTLDILLGPQVGTPAPEIVYTLASDPNTTATLSSHRGKVVVVDFWATWCGPCQEPMARLNTYKAAHPEWGDRVVLLALSIDNSLELLNERLKANNWYSVTNGWAGEDGFQAQAPTDYGVDSIPRMFIVGPDGKIAVGPEHPASVNIPEKVNELLKKAPRAAKAEKKKS